MFYLPRAAVKNYRKLENKENELSHSCGGQNSKIKVLAGWFLLETARLELSRAFLPASQYFIPFVFLSVLYKDTLIGFRAYINPL